MCRDDINNDNTAQADLLLFNMYLLTTKRRIHVIVLCVHYNDIISVCV